VSFLKDRWIAAYENALAEREFAGFKGKHAEELAKHDADTATIESLTDEADYARMIRKEGGA